MKKITLIALGLATVYSASSLAEGADDQLLVRNKIIDEMRFTNEKLSFQAEMAKNIKVMIDAGMIVDEKGVPMGVGDMELLALEVRRRGALQSNQSGTSFKAADPFGGADPIIRMPAGQNLFGDTAFGPTSVPAKSNEPAKVEESKASTEVVEKPSDTDKAKGAQLLRLAEIRGQTAVFFTNDGFKEVKIGEKVYDKRLTALGVDSATVKDKDGSRIISIDWTKSVRYKDD